MTLVGACRAGADDAAALGSVLARAFVAYPPLRWILPDDRAYHALAPATFARIVERGVAAGEVWTDTGRRCAAVWLPPPAGARTGAPEASSSGGAPASGGSPSGRPSSAAGYDAARVARFVEVTSRHLPDEPHWWLDALGTDPDAQRSGLARAVTADVLRRATAGGVAVWLRTGLEVNVSIYRALGFDVVDEFTIGDDGPRCWMLRKPARA